MRQHHAQPRMQNSSLIPLVRVSRLSLLRSLRLLFFGGVSRYLGFLLGLQWRRIVVYPKIF